MPQRRVPPVEPQAAPLPVAPTARENAATATRIVRAPAPVREEPIEPADLRTSPAAARALPQDATRERVGERPLPARAPSEARSDPAADTPVPALPAFLGVTTQRALPAARPPSAAPAQSAATVPAPQPPQAPAPAARPVPEAQSALPQPNDGAPTEATTSVQPVQSVQPRSMATPTLPQGFPTPTPRSEQMNPRSEESLRSEDEDAASSRNSSAQAAPPAPVAEAAPAVEPVLPVAPPRQPAVFRAADGAATEGRDETEEAAATSERQPLSVRSFATTIQARRANPVPPVAAPAAAPAVPAVAAVERQPVTPDAAPPVAAARPQPAPVETPHRPAEPAPADRELGEPAAPQAPTESASPARTLTLEEEMERLLHDFTLDVSDRR